VVAGAASAGESTGSTERHKAIQSRTDSTLNVTGSPPDQLCRRDAYSSPPGMDARARLRNTTRLFTCPPAMSSPAHRPGWGNVLPHEVVWRCSSQWTYITRADILSSSRRLRPYGGRQSSPGQPRAAHVLAPTYVAAVASSVIHSSHGPFHL